MSGFQKNIIFLLCYCKKYYGEIYKHYAKDIIMLAILTHKCNCTTILSWCLKQGNYKRLMLLLENKCITKDLVIEKRGYYSEESMFRANSKFMLKSIEKIIKMNQRNVLISFLKAMNEDPFYLLCHLNWVSMCFQYKSYNCLEDMTSYDTTILCKNKHLQYLFENDNDFTKHILELDIKYNIILNHFENYHNLPLNAKQKLRKHIEKKKINEK